MSGYEKIVQFKLINKNPMNINYWTLFWKPINVNNDDQFTIPFLIQQNEYGKCFCTIVKYKNWESYVWKSSCLIRVGERKKLQRKPDQDFNIFQQAYQELKLLWLKL